MKTLSKNFKRISRQFGKKSVLFSVSLFLVGISTLNAQEMTEKEKNGYIGGVLLAEKFNEDMIKSGVKFNFEDLKEGGGFFEALSEGFRDAMNGQLKLSKAGYGVGSILVPELKKNGGEFIFEYLKGGEFFEALRTGFRDAINDEIKFSKEEIMSSIESFQQKMAPQQQKEKEMESEQKNESQYSIDYQRTIARHHASLSWYYLFTKEYVQSEQSARKALELDNTYLLPKTNLAHALLFQNRFTEAEHIYKELSQTIYQDNETYNKVLLNDFVELKKAGVIPENSNEDMEKIRQILQDQK